MNKIVNFGVLFLIFCVLVGDLFFILESSLLIKSLSSFGFVLIGLISLLYFSKQNVTIKKFTIMMLIGLIFAMFGDIVLEIDFIIGAILFAIGHVFYFVAYCCLNKFLWNDLLIGASIFIPATLIILFLPIFDFGGALMQLLCVVYAIIISCMTGKAISNYIKLKNFLTLILMIGSCLFLFSDLMLLFTVFCNISKVFRYLCLISYYPAEILLALSLFINKKNKENI